MKPCVNCEAEKECSSFSRSEEQPYGVEMFTADDVFIKQIVIAKANTMVPQHSHMYDHTTMVAKGSVITWSDGEIIGEFSAPQAIFIRANTKHKFLTKTDDTILYCIHNVSKEKEVKIVEEHQIVGEARCQ